MPKFRNDDWERLFGPNAPRRGGPLQALANTLLVLIVLALLGAGSVFAVRYRQEQQVSLAATATVVAATVYPQRTATAIARAQATAARLELQTATALAAQVTPVPSIGVGVVTNGGNLRSEPVIADSTVIGLIWPGDQIAFLEQRDVGGQVWFRVLITKPADNRGGPGVESGREGWASATLLSPPTP